MLLLAPAYVHAQSLQEFFVGLLTLLVEFILPLLMGLAVLFFVLNVLRYFVIGSDEPEGRSHARYLALYGILTFVFLVSFWGIIWFMLGGTGFPFNVIVIPDYIP